MRISTQMMYDQNMRGITNSQSEWLKYGEQMSTEQRVNRPSDDPIAASQAVVVSQAQAQNNQYALARTFASQKISLEDNVLGQVASAITSAQTKVINAGNDSLSDDDRASLATDLQGVRDQLMNLANSTDGNGRYIFAGYKTDKPPFDAARTMTIAHTGTQVFDALTGNAVAEPDGSAPETSLFKMLDTAIAALKTPVSGDETAQATAQAALDKTNRGLRNSLNNVLSVRAEVGTQLDELDKLDALGSDRKLGLSSQMSALVDVDWSAAISSYTMKQAALQASYKAFSDMQGMSLFQMNR